MAKLPEIPSEFIEPYLMKFLGYLIDSIAMGLITPAEARSDFKGVEHFISLYAGIHARYACSNELTRFIKLPDEEMIKVCKTVAMSVTVDD